MESLNHTTVLSIKSQELREEREAVQVTDRSSKERVFKVKEKVDQALTGRTSTSVLISVN